MMAYYITRDGFRPEELGGDYYFGDPNRSPLNDAYEPHSPIHLSNKLYKFHEHLLTDKALAEKLRDMDPEFYALGNSCKYLPHLIYDKVYATRNEYQDFVGWNSLTTYKGHQAFKDDNDGYLVLNEDEELELKEYEEGYQRAFEEWKCYEIECGTPEDELEEWHFEEYSDYDQDFFSGKFSAGSVWVDFKDETKERLMTDIKRIVQDLERLGSQLSSYINIHQSQTL